MSKKLSNIQLLSAIQPEERDGQLVSPLVEEEFDAHQNKQRLAWRQLLEAEPGSLAEARASRWLARFNILHASKKLAADSDEQRGIRRDIWARRFTEASKELYAPPEMVFVRRILLEEVKFFTRYKNEYAQRVCDFYSTVLERITIPKTADNFSGLTTEDCKILGASFEGIYRKWFAHMEDRHLSKYAPSDMQKLFAELIDIASVDNPEWSQWRCELSESRDIVSVRPSSRVIAVGEDRVNADLEDMRGLVAHEMGVHAARAVNGSLIDGRLQKGLPGYIGAEESLGILAEAFVNGEIPRRAKDRYVDIAFALGEIKGVRLGRDELSALGLDRALARSLARQETLTRARVCKLLSEIKVHVHRIFRGGDGLEGAFAAVFTKDALYYPAHLERYIKNRLEAGDAPEDILRFLLQGKFDPDNESHLQIMREMAQNGADVLLR